MRKTVTLLFIFSFFGKIYSQNLDSLFNAFVSSKNQIEVITPSPYVIEGEQNNNTVGDKCGFGLNAIVRENFENFTYEQQKILKQHFTRPSADTSIVTPSGKFRIHFYKSGVFTPNYSGIEFPDGSDHLKIMMDSVAAAFDYAYNYEVNVLGYPPPPSDNGEGGDDLYDIYINSAGGSYGGTSPEEDLPNNRYTSYIEIHYSFNPFYTKGINAVRVTAAHEFHHAIQIGNYIYNTNELYYYEITSTAMEEFVCDDVNDYYAYMSNYFNNPVRTFSRSISDLDGYDLAIWNIFLKERFGFDILKRIWEIMTDGKSALVSISQALNEEPINSTFKDEFNLFGQQIFFTNYRAASNTIFDEARNYPLLKFSAPYTESKTIAVNSNAAANNYIMFAINNGTYTDSVVSVITNCDLNDNVSFDYSFFTNSSSGGEKIINNYYSSISSSQLGMLKQSNIFNNEPVSGDIEKSVIDFPYPQPFNYSNSNHYFISIPAAYNETGKAYLNVYSVSMDLVYSGEVSLSSGNKIRVLWNGRDKNNDKLPTGVYIYATKSGDTVKKGKIVIYNE